MQKHGEFSLVKRRKPILSRLPLVDSVLGRYTAGFNLSDAITKSKELSDKKFGSILNLLGEHDSDVKTITQTFETYMQLIGAMKNQRLLRPAISLKPTQFGLSHDGSSCDIKLVTNLLNEISLQAMNYGIFVWFDMENRFTTDFTLNIYRNLAIRNPDSVGIAIQANLKRSLSDIKSLSRLPHQVKIRLVRGIYLEPPEVAYDKEEAHRSLDVLLIAAFESNNISVSLGSHHPNRILKALELSTIKGKSTEFQFLLGAAKKIPNYITEQLDLPCTYYVPFGPRFLDYGLRRLRENPYGMLGLILSPIFERRNLSIIEKGLAD